MAAPFHSDSQSFLGVPPHVQVMACLRAAGAGGESLYLDTWALLERIALEHPALCALLFEAPRRFPFVFGDVFGPTVSLRGGSLVFTHTAFPEEGDPVAGGCSRQTPPRSRSGSWDWSSTTTACSTAAAPLTMAARSEAGLAARSIQRWPPGSRSLRGVARAWRSAARQAALVRARFGARRRMPGPARRYSRWS
jgi:hypothetical protein